MTDPDHDGLRPYLKGDPPRPCAGEKHLMSRAPNDARAWICDRCGTWKPFNIDGDQPDERLYKALLAERYPPADALANERDTKEAP